MSLCQKALRYIVECAFPAECGHSDAASLWHFRRLRLFNHHGWRDGLGPAQNKDPGDHHHSHFVLNNHLKFAKVYATSEGSDIMYKLCKTEESSRRQREFETALLTVMQAKPYPEISVTELCRKVGIARKNFYRYFENKDDVLCALLDHTILEFSLQDTAEIMNPSESPIEIVQFLSYWEQQKPLLDALQMNGLSTKLIERVLVHARTQDPGFLRLLGKYADDNTVLFTVSGIITLVVTWHHLGFRQTSAELAGDIYRLMTQPIVSIP